MESYEIIYEQDLSMVDWVELKQSLQEDDFDNGRSPEQLERSFQNSAKSVIAYLNGRIIGTVRGLSDGVCNAYVVDVWTHSNYRNQGIAKMMMQIVLKSFPGQHVYLFTDNAEDFYRKLGFKPQGVGMGLVVGQWLVNEASSE